MSHDTYFQITSPRRTILSRRTYRATLVADNSLIRVFFVKTTARDRVFSCNYVLMDENR